MALSRANHLELEWSRDLDLPTGLGICRLRCNGQSFLFLPSQPNGPNIEPEGEASSTLLNLHRPADAKMAVFRKREQGCLSRLPVSFLIHLHGQRCKRETFPLQKDARDSRGL